jgi:hypothetical protein
MTNIQCNLFIVLGVHFKGKKRNMSWNGGRGRTVLGRGAGKVNVTDDMHAFLFQMLDENNQLIQAITDYQNKGKAAECMQ